MSITAGHVRCMRNERSLVSAPWNLLNVFFRVLRESFASFAYGSPVFSSAYCSGSFIPFGIGKGSTPMPSSSRASVCSGVAWPRMPRSSLSP